MCGRPTPTSRPTEQREQDGRPSQEQQRRSIATARPADAIRYWPSVQLLPVCGQPQLQQSRIGNEALGEAVALGSGAGRRSRLQLRLRGRRRSSGCAARAAPPAGASAALPADGPAQGRARADASCRALRPAARSIVMTGISPPSSRQPAGRGQAACETPPCGFFATSDLKLPSLPSSELPLVARGLSSLSARRRCSTVRLSSWSSGCDSLADLVDLGERLAELGGLGGGLRRRTAGRCRPCARSNARNPCG